MPSWLLLYVCTSNLSSHLGLPDLIRFPLLALSCFLLLLVSACDLRSLIWFWWRFFLLGCSCSRSWVRWTSGDGVFQHRSGFLWIWSRTDLGARDWVLPLHLLPAYRCEGMICLTPLFFFSVWFGCLVSSRSGQYKVRPLFSEWPVGRLGEWQRLRGVVMIGVSILNRKV